MKILIVLLISVGCLTTNVVAQTLKITSVQSTDPNKYQEMAKRHLGKIITLKFYDDAIDFKEGQDDIIMKKIGDNSYEYDEDQNRMVVELHYTLGVVTSLSLTAISIGGGNYKNTVTAYAKRF